MANTIVVANRFLELAEEDENTLTPMQLLKLVYIAHGWMLGLYGTPLIDSDIQAWQYGPVIPDLYDRVRKHKSQPVVGPISTGFFGGGKTESLQPHEDDLVRQVYNLYGNFSGMTLSGLTHQAGSPWSMTYSPDSFGVVISNDLIQEHYSRKVNEARQRRQ